MSTSYIVMDVLQPEVTRVKVVPGVDYSARPEFDDQGEPSYPPDGTIQLVFYPDGDGSVGINLSLELADSLWGTLGHVIQAVKHERQPAP